jgi:hypothetical protein
LQTPESRREPGPRTVVRGPAATKARSSGNPPRFTLAGPSFPALASSARMLVFIPRQVVKDRRHVCFRSFARSVRSP